MKIVAAVLTWNPIEHHRLDLLEATVASLSEVEVVVVDNGSTDGSDRLISSRWSRRHLYRGPNTTSGHGTNLCARVAIGTGADVCVLSDDDMDWQPGWAKRLARWWESAPEDVWLTGCHLEPEFFWNEVGPTVVFGGVPGVLRASTGAASWSFRAADWPKIGPIPEKRQGWGDVPACERIHANGGKVAQIDLAEHAGHGRSSWGNRTVELYGWDVESVRQKLESVPA